LKNLPVLWCRNDYIYFIKPRLDMPGAALCTVEHAIGHRVIDNVFAFRVPANLPAQHHCNIAEVCRRGRAVTDLNGRNRLCSRLDAVEEVTAMPLTMLTRYGSRLMKRPQ
jgi:hypothetical protein